MEDLYSIVHGDIVDDVTAYLQEIHAIIPINSIKFLHCIEVGFACSTYQVSITARSIKDPIDLRFLGHLNLLKIYAKGYNIIADGLDVDTVTGFLDYFDVMDLGAVREYRIKPKFPFNHRAPKILYSKIKNVVYKPRERILFKNELIDAPDATISVNLSTLTPAAAELLSRCTYYKIFITSFAPGKEELANLHNMVPYQYDYVQFQLYKYNAALANIKAHTVRVCDGASKIIYHNPHVMRIKTWDYELKRDRILGEATYNRYMSRFKYTKSARKC